MTVLESTIEIAAPPARVWELLGTLDALERYDPGIARSRIVSTERAAWARSGWFRERVTAWEPERSLGFELYECTLPVKRRHAYVLTPIRGGTRVEQRMEYRLKFGPLGVLMDAVIVRRRWKAGIDGFLSGLKRIVEGGAGTVRS